ncbi:MAG: Nucleotidyltransferase domain protein [Candidatus Methanolliviera sp. GoM_oil]|nr:MAG: Nucleotidyltransferase domain protein [Candidatus Methanolliviera sp. GoM_oil]
MNEPLKEIIERIKEEAHPDRIILFGSRAKDKARKSSDYDICVLVKRGVNLKDLEKRLYLKLFGTKVAVDIITEFVDRFEENKNNRYLIYHEIAKDAIIVYE